MRHSVTRRAFILVATLVTALAGLAIPAYSVGTDVPALSISEPRASVEAGMLDYTISWTPVPDVLGAPTSYTVTVTDSASGVKLADTTTTATVLVLSLPMPPTFDEMVAYKVSVQAIRRDRPSEAVEGMLHVIRMDHTPNAPVLTIDGYPIALVAGATDCERKTITGPVLDIRRDTVFFLTPDVGQPSQVSCVPRDFVVLIEGIQSGAQVDSVPQWVFGKGEPLPVQVHVAPAPAAPILQSRS